MSDREVADWPLAPDHVLMANGRFRGEADKYKHRP
jgi:hypothetical protein